MKWIKWVIHAECHSHFSGNNLMSKGCTMGQGTEGWSQIREQFIKIKCQMTQKTENGKNRRRKRKWNERKVKNIAQLNLCLSAKRERERKREEGKGEEVGATREHEKRARVAWVSESKVNWLAPPLQHSTASTAARNKQMLRLLATYNPPTHSALLHREQGPCKNSSVTLSHSVSPIHLGPLDDVVASILMLYWPTRCSRYSTCCCDYLLVYIPYNNIYNYIHNILASSLQLHF